ncbi:MAG: hypothetical protein RDU25_02515 [Patescibacteria group bacterium]|nr:hypothetical protein [Patescibacteria group bacterium]
MNKQLMTLVFAVLGIIGLIGCGDNEPKRASSDGTTVPADQCPALGSASAAEGAKCAGNVVHCGFWVPANSSAAYAACQDNSQPPSTCNAGQSCSTPGVACTDSSGVVLECYCGMWANALMKSQIDCSPSNPNPGTGGSGGSGGSSGGTGGSGSGGSYGSPASGYDTFHIEVLASAQHIYCEGASTEPSFGDDVNVKFFEYWHSFGCDSFDGSFSCDIFVPSNAALRFQCYMQNPDPEPGDQIRYTCANPTQLLQGESFTVSRNGTVVSTDLAANLAPEANPQSSYNCVNLGSAAQ